MRERQSFGRFSVRFWREEFRPTLSRTSHRSFVIFRGVTNETIAMTTDTDSGESGICEARQRPAALGRSGFRQIGESERLAIWAERSRGTRVDGSGCAGVRPEIEWAVMRKNEN